MHAAFVRKYRRAGSREAGGQCDLHQDEDFARHTVDANVCFVVFRRSDAHARALALPMRFIQWTGIGDDNMCLRGLLRFLKRYTIRGAPLIGSGDHAVVGRDRHRARRG
jgi:hypothetical protein